ncbi:MAG TPA: hypothetical protein VNS02_07365 [Rhizobiaceae bacterium]|nr:hypothetical protein [Rhizobiaceae bacterium]
MELLLVLGLSGVIFGGGCAVLASNKNRDVVSWFVLGFLFNLVALIVIAALSPVDATSQTEAGADGKSHASGETFRRDDLRQKAALLAEELAQSRAKVGS